MSRHCQEHGVPTIISQPYCLKSDAFPPALALLQELKLVLGQAQSEEQMIGIFLQQREDVFTFLQINEK